MSEELRMNTRDFGTTPKLISLSDAIERSGLPRHKINRRIVTNGIQTYRDPMDYRRRLISVDDVERLLRATRIESTD